MALGLVPFESQAAPSAVMRNGSATKWSPIGLAAGILLCPNIPSVAQTLSIRMESSPPWSVRNEADQVLRRPPSKIGLIILLSQASHFQQWADPTNAVGIFPQELCRAQLSVTPIRVCIAKTLNHQEGFTA